MSLKSLIGLEQSASRALRSTIDLATAKLNHEVSQAVKSKDHALALQLIANFDLTDQVQHLQSVYDHLAISTAIFGASQLKPAAATKFTQGKGLKQVLRGARMMSKMAISIGNTQVRQRADAAVRSSTPKERQTIVRKTFEPMCCSQHQLLCEPVSVDLVKADPTADYEDISDALNAATLGSGRMAADIAANLTTTRLAAYGFLSQAKDDGITQFQITAELDDRTCAVCLYMNGQTLDVDSAFARADDALSADNPDELEDITPWPDQSKAGLENFVQMDPEELQAAGYDCPPFHPSCRCVLVPVGTISDSEVQEPLTAGEAEDVTSGGDWMKALRDLLADDAGDPDSDQALDGDAESDDLNEAGPNTEKKPKP